MPDIILETKNLGISFGGLKAVEDVNLQIHAKQIYGLVGPNGAGKTTVFNLLTGVYQPTCGTFFLEGEELTGKTQETINHKGIARTFQNIRLFNNMSVIRNVLVGLHNQPEFRCSPLASMLRLPKHFDTEDRMRQRAKEILRIFGLEEMRNQLSCNLPYGQQRKLEIARALATNPKILLLDEPAAGMNPKEVVSYIEGEPFINTVPIETGFTNTVIKNDESLVVGLNSENPELHEGMIRFDIIFYVRMKDGLSQIIINVEAQKDEPNGYDILNRAIFYVSRMISSQKERDFSNSNYNDIKRVYSIWVCMNMPENSLEHIHLVKDSIVNSHAWKGKLDLVNIVMIGLAKELPKHEEKYELHRLLGALLSQDLTANEKLDIIGNEYAIPMEKDFREDVSIMCNLSQKIKETGIETGIEMGKREMIMKMYNKGYTAAQIADVAEMDEKQIKEIIKNAELLTV